MTKITNVIHPPNRKVIIQCFALILAGANGDEAQIILKIKPNRHESLLRSTARKVERALCRTPLKSVAVAHIFYTDGIVTDSDIEEARAALWSLRTGGGMPPDTPSSLAAHATQ